MNAKHSELCKKNESVDNLIKNIQFNKTRIVRIYKGLTTRVCFDLLFDADTITTPPITVNKCVLPADENVLTRVTRTDTQIPHDVSLSV